MKKVQLYHNTKLGKIKTWIIYTEGGDRIEEWGILGGKMQQTIKHCKSVNAGKANERLAEVQAEAEALSKIREKKEEGYTEEIPDEGTQVVNAEIDFENLPKPFCPSKPISACPKGVENDPNTYGQRKLNGNCIILKKAKSGNKIYSRTMTDLTNALCDVPEIVEKFKAMKIGQMLNTEIRYFYNKTKKESTSVVGSLLRTQDKKEVIEKYNGYVKEGTFEVCPFDILFDKGKFIGNLDHLDRHTKLVEYGFNPPEIIEDWKKYVETAKKEGWEGFVLRVPGKSQVTYTLNGKADRAGAYKWKFMKEGDFVVTELGFGDSGEHADLYCRFKIGQYDNGILLDCGWAGPGTLKREQLRDFTEDIKSGNLLLPFVVEIEYRDVQEAGYKLEHPVIQRLRFDKRPEECIYEGL